MSALLAAQYAVIGGDGPDILMSPESAALGIRLVVDVVEPGAAAR